MPPAPDMEITMDERKFRSVQRMVRNIPRGLNKVMSRAINKVAVSGRKRIVDVVAADLRVKKGVLKKKNIKLKRASFFKWRAEINITGKRIPLIQFVTGRQKLGERLKRGGVSWRISRTGGRKVNLHMFIAMMRSGHRGVFARAELGGSRVPRLPIIEQRGPSVPQVFSNIAEFSRGILDARLAKNLTKEVITQVGVLIEQEAKK